MPWHPCVNSRDTITAVDGLVLQNFRALGDDQHTVSSHCRDANGTWITWYDNTDDDTLVGGFNDISTYTGNNFPVHVGYFPDDGSVATVYDLAVGYIWQWTANGRYSHVNPCFIHAPASSKYFGNNIQCELSGWNTSVQDVQVRTDGTNVWVIVLAQESVMYPWLSTVKRLDRCGIPHLSILEDALGEGLIPGGDGAPFIHDTFPNRAAPGGASWWQQTGVIGVDNPDDAGPHSSFRWQPMRVTVYAGDLGGFTDIGKLEAQYFNTAGDNGAGIIGLSSGIEAASSSSEPGQLHTLWAEAGTQGEFQAGFGERVTYAQWGTGSQLAGYDIPGMGWTAEMILRNDHGSPAAIILPWDGDVTFGPPEYWDLSIGAVVQTMDASLYPTPAEVEDVVTPQGRLTSLSGDTTTTTNFRRSHFASSLYTDPTLENQDVYLICVGFAVATPNTLGANDRVAFYRIPADGSDTFDFMDGTRLVMYSIIPPGALGDLANHANADFVSDPGNVWIPCAPANLDGGGVLHLPRTCTRTWELLDAFPETVSSRPAQPVNEGTWVAAGESVKSHTSPPTIFTDNAGNDWLAGGGIATDLTFDAQAPVTVAALQAKICRCCVPCIERIGLHIWEKV